MTEPETDVRAARWPWLAAIWCAGGLFDASQTVLIAHREGHHDAWLPLFATELALWMPWALATPFIGALVRRHANGPGVTVRIVAMHLGTFATVAVVAEAWSAWLQVLFNPWGNRRWPTFVDTWSTSLLYQALTFVIVYSLILTVTLMLDSRERTARLNEELSSAQLAALRRQMEPHFMFNTLNTIAGMVRDHKISAAVNMIVGLSEFLRRAMEDSHRSQVTLGEEVEYLQRYLDIQKGRFGERLQLSLHVPIELLGARVPNLLLQPLVENAIKHGIAKRVAGGIVRIAAARLQESLRLTIYNDGPSLPVDWEVSHTGVGIGNLRTRLRILHGDHAELHLRRVDVDGVEAMVTLPLKEA